LIAFIKAPDGYRIWSRSPRTELPGSVQKEVSVQLSNYLFFSTHCEQALAFYTECGLGRVTEMLRYGEGGMPAGGDTMRGRIMHARFEGPGVLFFASDNDDAEPMRGSAHILSMNDRAHTECLFGQLAEGGTITTALAVQPWGRLLRQADGPVWRALDTELRRTSTGRQGAHPNAPHYAARRQPGAIDLFLYE
jgi:PhnB protein